jgi:RNA polymerase sigma factor (sigma-70 family)
MSRATVSPALRFVRTIASGPSAGLADGQLLEHFLRDHSETAFAALWRRHGPMVFGVCRRLLGNTHDAEDAFQATFLVLARKAGSLDRAASIGPWLHAVAWRTARRARARAARRRARERPMTTHPEARPGNEAAARDLKPIIDEEVGRLPEKYRAAIVLCYLEGKTHHEAARQLRWPVGTVKGRLARARRMLHGRLTRRGLAFGTAALAGILGQGSGSAAVPAALAGPTFEAAVLVAAGNAAAGLISGPVATLYEGVLYAMFLTKLKMVAAVLLTIALLVGGTGVVTYRAWAATSPGQLDDDPPKQEKRHDKVKMERKEANSPERRGYLGLQLSGDDDGRVVVQDVFPDSPAAKAGIKAVDIIVRVGEVFAKDGPEALAKEVGQLRRGSRVVVKVKRGEDEKEFRVTVGDRAQMTQRGHLGLALKLGEDGEVIIQEVMADSPAEKADLKEGDRILRIGEVEIKDRESLSEATSRLKAGERVTVRIKRGDEEKNIEIKLSKAEE